MLQTAAGAGGWRRLWWSLAGRIWLTSVLLVLLMGVLGVSIAARLAILERSVNQVLSRNYRSIQAANGMLQALSAFHSGETNPAEDRAGFERMLSVARGNITEPGEDKIVETIARQAGDFFAGPPNASVPAGLHRSLAGLIAINERAMFSADRHTVAVARGSRVEALIFLLIGVVFLTGSSYALSRTLVDRPLADLIRTVRMIDSEQSLRSMAPPRTSELAELADEFNRMIWRLQTDSSKRLAELDRERSKTATIIESIEDGVIVLDPQRAIVHMNEVASAILDVHQSGILGTRLEDLGHRGSHAARLVAALEHRTEDNGAPMEFKVFLRGRDHTYLVRELPWTAASNANGAGGPTGREEVLLGNVVLLQDVTLLRDREKAHSH